MTSESNHLSRQALKSAIWYTVFKIIQEEEIALQNSSEIALQVTTSEVFVASLTEAVMSQALALGKDLEAFAHHAGRTTVGVEEVKLAVRNNPGLHELISTEATKHGLALAALRPKPTKRPLPKPKPAVKGKAKRIQMGSDDEKELEDQDEEPAVKPKKPRAKKIAKKKLTSEA